MTWLLFLGAIAAGSSVLWLMLWLSEQDQDDDRDEDR